MADSSSLQAPQGSSVPPAQSKRRSGELEAGGGEKKAKTKHLAVKETSKAAEREASRRHQALEKEFSKAQRLRSSETELVSPVSLDTPASGPPCAPLQDAPRASSPQGETEQVDHPRSSPSLSQQSTREQADMWSQDQFQAFMHQAFKQFMAKSGQGPSHPPVPQAAPPPQAELDSGPGSGVSEASSQLGEEESIDLETVNTPMSEDDEPAPEQVTSSGLFDPSLFRSLLLKACSTTNLSSAQEEVPSTSTSQESNPLFRLKVAQDKQIPCPMAFRTTVEEQWSSLATTPSPSSLDKKLYNVSSSFASLLEVPVVDAPLTSLFSTTAIPGDMAEFLKAEDKKFEFSLRRAHQSSAGAIKAATSSSFFARASIMWLQELQALIPPDQVRAHHTLGKLVAASEYVVDASLHSAKCSARSIAANVAARRMLWLKQWRTDLKSKWRLSTSKYCGSQLFGAILEPHVVEGKDKRKVLAHPSKRLDRRASQDSCRQTFRTGGSWEWRPPFRAGQSWDWPRGSRSFPPRQDRQQDRPNSGARGQFASKRPFRGTGGRPYRRSK